MGRRTCWNLGRGLKLLGTRVPEIYTGDAFKQLLNTKLLVCGIQILEAKERQVAYKLKNSEPTQSSET